MRKFFYRVKEGDSLTGISAEYNAPLADIILDNALITEPVAGDVLFIRGNKASYTVSPFDTAEIIAEKFGISSEEIKRKNGNFPYFFYGMRINA